MIEETDSKWMMNKISSTIVGAAGEYHVLSHLLRRGWIAALAPDGAPNMDILVTDENNNKLCAIQVKTRRDIGSDKGWHMKPKHEILIADALFYVFVDVGKKPSDPTNCYILPSKAVADCIRLCHQVWLDTPGREGRPHKDSSVRRLGRVPIRGFVICEDVIQAPDLRELGDGPLRSDRLRMACDRAAAAE